MKREEQLNNMRKELIEVLSKLEVSPEEASFVFGLIIGPVCLTQAALSQVNPRSMRKYLEDQFSDGIKASLNEVRKHEFLTRTVQDE